MDFCSKHKTENAQSAKKEQPERPTHKEASKKRIQEYLRSQVLAGDDYIVLSACHCRLREGRDRKRCDPAFCFVRPANIIICPTSGYIARAAGGWSEPIILRPKRPTPASCLLRTASNTSRQNLPLALALYCSRFKPSNLQPLHRRPHHHCCYLSSSSNYDTTTPQTDQNVRRQVYKTA